MPDELRADDSRVVGVRSIGVIPATLAVSVTQTDGTAIVTFRGDLDVATREPLRRTLDDMVRLEPALVVVDLSQVGLFDCGAIGEFLRARSALRERGSTLVLRGPSTTGLLALSVVGLLDLVSVAPQRDTSPTAPAEDPATMATEIGLLRDAWRTACETHPTMSRPVVFRDPEMIITEILEALDPGAAPFRTSAGELLPDTLTQDVPMGRLAVLQLLELRRVMQAWIGWCHFPPSRDRELQRQLSDVVEVTVLEVVSTALAELERAALVDPLTGLMNRRALDRDLTQFLAAARRHGRALTVVMLDVVGLKSVNDRFGHDAGDELLQDVSAALVGTLRVGDNVYRIGGDEFVLLLPDLQPEDVDAVMNRTIVTAGGSFTWGSAGLPSDFPTVAATPASLLKLADQRMMDHRTGAARGVPATLRVLDERPARNRLAGESPQLVRRLSGASRSHSVIEQAKGILAEYFETDVNTAAAALRDFAVSRGESVRGIAYAVVDRTIEPAELSPLGGRADVRSADGESPLSTDVEVDRP